jgi:hypothetical protein
MTKGLRIVTKADRSREPWQIGVIGLELLPVAMALAVLFVK